MAVSICCTLGRAASFAFACTAMLSSESCQIVALGCERRALRLLEKARGRKSCFAVIALPVLLGTGGQSIVWERMVVSVPDL